MASSNQASLTRFWSSGKANGQAGASPTSSASPSARTRLPLPSKRSAGRSPGPATPMDYHSQHEPPSTSTHVSMPCCGRQRRRWDASVTPALAAPPTDWARLEAVWSQLHANKRTPVSTALGALRTFVQHVATPEESRAFWRQQLPSICAHALATPRRFLQPIPLLRVQRDTALLLEQKQAASVLACAWWDLWPRPPTSTGVPGLSMASLWRSQAGVGCSAKRAAKIRCILHYFGRLRDKKGGAWAKLSFRRQVIPTPVSWPNMTAALTRVHVTAHGAIEDAPNHMLHVDFANASIGGGVLSHGCVQEEIRFLICPELMIARIFCCKLQANEVILMNGAERFSTYTGYANTFAWTGDFVDDPTVDTYGRRKSELVAMDALTLQHRPKSQFTEKAMLRELNKAYAGFYDAYDEGRELATGAWGAGAFGGDAHLKALLQVCAASACERSMHYHAFGDEVFAADFTLLMEQLHHHGWTVCALWQCLRSYTGERVDHGNTAFHHVRNHIATTHPDDALPLDVSQLPVLPGNPRGINGFPRTGTGTRPTPLSSRQQPHSRSQSRSRSPSRSASQSPRKRDIIVLDDDDDDSGSGGGDHDVAADGRGADAQSVGEGGTRGGKPVLGMSSIRSFCARLQPVRRSQGTPTTTGKSASTTTATASNATTTTATNPRPKQRLRTLATPTSPAKDPATATTVRCFIYPSPDVKHMAAQAGTPVFKARARDDVPSRRVDQLAADMGALMLPQLHTRVAFVLRDASSGDDVAGSKVLRDVITWDPMVRQWVFRAKLHVK